MATPDTTQERIADDGPSLLLGLIGFNLRIKAFNPAWERQLGYPREKLIEKPLIKLVARSEYGTVFALVTRPFSSFRDKPV